MTPDPPCANCLRLSRELEEAHAVVVELWRQQRLRDQLRTGDFSDEPMPSLASMRAGYVVEKEAA